MDITIIQLELTDTAKSVCKKIEGAEFARVALIFPENCILLSRYLDILLLQRCARRLNIQLAIVSRNIEVIGHAEVLGLLTFSSVEHLKRGPWRRRRGRQRVKKLSKPRSRLAARRIFIRKRLTALQQQVKGMRHFEKGGSGLLHKLLFVSGLLAVIALFLLLWPSAVVQLSMAHQSQNIVLGVSANPETKSISLSGRLPVKTISVELEGSNKAISSGQIKVPDKPAGGLIRLTSLTNQIVKVPQDTIVLALTDPVVRFRTRVDAEVPARSGETVDVAVESLTPGLEGNVPASTVKAFSGSLGLNLQVTNPDAMTGGSERLAPAPTEEDYRTLREKILVLLKDKALVELKNQVSEGQRLIETSLEETEIISERREPAEQKPADMLQLTVKVRYHAWVIRVDDERTLVRSILDAGLPQNFVPVPDSMTIETIENPYVDQWGNARWQIQASRQISQQWQPAMLDQLAGLNKADAVLLLQKEYRLTQQPVINLMPWGWRWMPYLTSRISVLDE